jgi:hypothetical protein
MRIGSSAFEADLLMGPVTEWGAFAPTAPAKGHDLAVDFYFFLVCISDQKVSFDQRRPVLENFDPGMDFFFFLVVFRVDLMFIL